jgi:hypothetical protein
VGEAVHLLSSSHYLHERPRPVPDWKRRRRRSTELHSPDCWASHPRSWLLGNVEWFHLNHQLYRCTQESISANWHLDGRIHGCYRSWPSLGRRVHYYGDLEMVSLPGLMHS